LNSLLIKKSKITFIQIFYVDVKFVDVKSLATLHVFISIWNFGIRLGYA